MQVVGAADQGLALKPLAALIGHAVTVGVGELPDARRRGDIPRTVVPQTTFREHHLVRENGGFVEGTIGFSLFEAHDAVGLLLQLLVGLFVRTGAIGNVKAAFIVEGG